MKKILTAILIALMALLPTMVQAKVTHLLPKAHSVVENGGTPFALGRKVSITDETGCVALQKFFTDNDCTIGDGGATVNVTIVESIQGAHDYPSKEDFFFNEEEH